MNDLNHYHGRRNASQSEEPSGVAQTQPERGSALPQALRYVIQKHASRHLHYDFRLELNGVLLSWSIPKGPCLDPAIKRLAVQVEPHPIAYGDFEGQIPEGQYGAGAVMVWDSGHWQSEDDDPVTAHTNGHLTFKLDGKKLKGSWHLVRTHRNSDTQWLLFKGHDQYAEPGEDTIIEREPYSVLSGRNIEQIASRPKAKHQKTQRVTPHFGTKPLDPSPAQSPRKGLATKSAQLEAKIESVEQLPGISLAQVPLEVEVQLSTLTDSTPVGDEWVHEIKFDGYRVVARIVDGNVQLLTRHGLDWTERIPKLAHALTELKLPDTIIDGELVALDAAGISHFQALQNALSLREEATLTYYAFDLLHYDNYDLRNVALLERKALLKQVVDQFVLTSGQEPSMLRFSHHVVGNGTAFFELASGLKLEGIVSKRAAGVHVPGRTQDWLKVKSSLRQEFVVLGYTKPAGSRPHFGALLVGVYEAGRLVYCGRVGTGFTERSLKDLHQRLVPLHTSTLDLLNAPKGVHARGVQWVEPKLVAQVAFSGFTQEGILRHPTFEGLRDDKPASDVHREASQASSVPKQSVMRSRRAATKLDTGGVRLTHPEKILYPESGLTKRDLLDYAARVATAMLPHIVNRPLTLVRCPNGTLKKCFFQKHPHDAQVPGLRSVAIREHEGEADYTAIDDEQGLFALMQLSALEIHTCGALADDFEHPNILVFDLDPDPSVAFGAVVDCARRLREVLQTANLQSFVKTTGGKGLHVCVPIEPCLSWDEAKSFTQRIAEGLVDESPNLYVATQSKAQRAGKIFIDYLRNARGATFVAPYSMRARPGAPVATPVFWDELTSELRPDTFTVANMPQRLAGLAEDPFARMATLKQALPKVG
jgi:bifunctional non-homologous end joining protein LigD